MSVAWPGTGGAGIFRLSRRRATVSQWKDRKAPAPCLRHNRQNGAAAPATVDPATRFHAQALP
jgi:hypothetical protein